MKPIMKYQRFLALLFIAGLMIGPARRVLAYIPPSQFMVDQIVKARVRVDRYRITSMVAAFDGEKTTSDSFREVTLVDLKEGILQSHVYDDDGKVLYETERRFRKSVDGKDAADSTTPAAFYLLFAARKDLVADALSKAGVPIQTDSHLASLENEEERRMAERTYLRRLGEEYSWVVGELDAAKPVPQLWVKKDAFLPIRLILTGGRQADLRFDKFSYAKGAMYPREMKLYLDEKPLFLSQIQKIEIDPRFNKFPETVGEGYSELGKSADDKIREMIDAYYLYLR